MNLLVVENSDDIAAANLITKFSFENSISDSKNGITGGVGTDVAMHPASRASISRIF
jgi:hypothetical protein